MEMRAEPEVAVTLQAQGHRADRLAPHQYGRGLGGTVADLADPQVTQADPVTRHPDQPRAWPEDGRAAEAGQLQRDRVEAAAGGQRAKVTDRPEAAQHLEDEIQVAPDGPVRLARPAVHALRRWSVRLVRAHAGRSPRLLVVIGRIHRRRRPHPHGRGDAEPGQAAAGGPDERDGHVCLPRPIVAFAFVCLQLVVAATYGARQDSYVCFRLPMYDSGPAGRDAGGSPLRVRFRSRTLSG